MRTTSQFTASLLRRILEFLQRQPIVTAIGDLKVQLTQLESHIQELERHAQDLESRRRASLAGTGKIAALAREAWLEHMRPVSRAARIVFRHDPQLRHSLRLGKRLYRAEAVIEALRGMADRARVHKAELVKEGLAEDFIERMLAVADALKAAVDARASEISRRAGASVGTLQAGLSGRDRVRLLDAMVAPRLAVEPNLLREWKSLLRQGRVRPPAPEEGDDADVTPASPSGAGTSPSAAA